MKKLLKGISLLIATISTLSAINNTAYAYTVPEHRQDSFNKSVERREKADRESLDAVIWLAVPTEDMELMRDCGIQELYASLESLKNDYYADLSCDVLRDCVLKTEGYWLYRFNVMRQTGAPVPAGDDYTFSAYISSSDIRLFSEDSAIIARCFTDSDPKSFYPDLDTNPVMTISADHFVTDEFVTEWQEKYTEELKTGSPFLRDTSFSYNTPLEYLSSSAVSDVHASNNAFIILGSIKNLANLVGHEENVFVSLLKEYFTNELVGVYEVSVEELANISLAGKGYSLFSTTLGATGHLKDYMTFIQPLGISIKEYAKSELAPALTPLRDFNDYKQRGDEYWKDCGARPQIVEMHADYLRQFGYNITLPDMSGYTAEDVLNFEVPLYIGEGTILEYPDYSAGITESPEPTPAPTATPIIVARATDAPTPTKNTIDTIPPVPTQIPSTTESDFPIRYVIILAGIVIITIGVVIVLVKRK